MILVLLASTVIAAWWRGNPLLARAVQSFAYRTEYWQATGRMIADHPLWGVGPGNFQNEYTRNKLPQASEEVADPHNFLLEIGATSGIPALLSMLAVLATFFGPCFCRRAAASAPSEPVDDGGQPRFALAGAAAGFLLALPMSLISNGRIENFTWMVGLPVAAVCLAVLWPWVDRGELPAGLPAAGAAGVLIHLLSSGGIGFPGVAGSLWLLLALGLNLRSGDTPRSMPRSAALAALALAAMMLVACYLTGYGPVMHAKADLRQAQAQPERAEEYLTAVAADDPWDVRPWNQLAVMALATWEQTADSESLERFERYSAESFRREPNASPAWLHWADAEMKIFARSGQRVHLERAIEGYQRAISLYPNNPVYHAQLAMALETRGDHDGFRHEAAQALDLHNSTPHSDKQLPLELRQRLLRSNTSPPHKQD